MPSRRRILVAMSGGVDSSVAALLLQRLGHEIAGVTMCLGTEGTPGQEREGRGRRCCSPEDIADARRVCRALGIGHHVVSMRGELERLVIEPFVSEYLRGRTPNPCVLCNRRLKFGVLIERLAASGYDLLATGHYARIVPGAGAAALARPKDLGKDQTYFLYSVDRRRLAHVVFPLAELAKDEVRSLAEEARLPVSRKRDSQDLCFLPRAGEPGLFARLGAAGKPGEIVSVDGEVLGRHGGIFNYTIGQRHGLGLSAPRPLYVVAMDPLRNRIVAGGEEHLYADCLAAAAQGFLPAERGGRAEAKIRYAHRAAPCRFSLAGDRLEVYFDRPQRAITPGQSVVLYRDDIVLGGGVIEGAAPAP